MLAGSARWEGFCEEICRIRVGFDPLNSSKAGLDLLAHVPDLGVDLKARSVTAFDRVLVVVLDEELGFAVLCRTCSKLSRAQ